MAAESKQNHSWVRIGATYGCVVAGSIAALVYYAGAQRGESTAGEGEQAEAGPGWYLVWVGEPHRHYQLAAPNPPSAAKGADVDKSALVALAEAGEAVEAKLGEGGSGPNGR